MTPEERRKALAASLMNGEPISVSPSGTVVPVKSAENSADNIVVPEGKLAVVL